jgi:hypothetical protein
VSRSTFTSALRFDPSSTDTDALESSPSFAAHAALKASNAAEVFSTSGSSMIFDRVSVGSWMKQRIAIGDARREIEHSKS